MLKLILFILPLLTGMCSFAQTLLTGYSRSIHGEELQYHSPQPDADRSLLVRSETSRNYIEWETEATPVTKSRTNLTFLMLAGIDVNRDDPHTWTVYLNDRAYFTIASPLDTVQKSLAWQGPEKAVLTFKTTQVDKYGDFMGYLTLHVPEGLFPAGKPIRIKVQGESANSRTWFMVFKYEASNKVNLVAENAITTTNRQVLRVDIAYYGDPQQGVISIDGKEHGLQISMGYNVFYQEIPVVTSPATFHVNVKAGVEVLTDRDFQVDPVIPFTIYLLHHSHNDIGYTHVQDEVERMQWKNLKDAMGLSFQSRNDEDGARFKWNTEVVWAVDSYLKQASPVDKEQFCVALRNGWIDLNALYSNTLTGLCTSRELIGLLEPARRIAQQCGVELTSAMVSDIPGWTWGLVPVLSGSGVRYLSLGNNNGHRVGTMNRVWGDKPFWWVSQSGEDSVLCWVHGKGYSYFHTGLGYEQLKKVLTEEKIHAYVNQLAAEKYPYDMVTLRYNIGSDNGPVDPTLIETVKSWNERYITPRLVISTVSESFGIFEEKYGHTLPSFAGDLTGYWEDGAYSSASETGMNRQNASRLEQAEMLWTLISPQAFPANDFRLAWQQVMLYDEHTWGSWNSISEPNSPFTLRQWQIKRSFALRADTLSEKLLADVLSRREPQAESIGAIEVFNTTSWERTDLVTLSPDLQLACSHLKDKAGNTAPLQVLTTGETVFLARDVPPLGSKIYYMDTREAQSSQSAETEKNSLENDVFSITLDPVTGVVSRLYDKSLKKELVDDTDLPGINSYYYVAGRDPARPQPVGMVKTKMKESGPVVSSLVIAAEAPGCGYLSREVRLIQGVHHVQIINRINKTNVLEPEGVYLAFPFRVPEGILRYDLGYAVCRMELDQLPGACRNYITIENWADVSNQDYGITWISLDAPIIEAKEITTDATAFGWIEKLQPTQTLYSYVMNNYWETNYKASQEGEFLCRYILFPHEGFDAAQSERMAIQQRNPLIAVPVRPDAVPLRLFPLWDHPSVNIMNIRPEKKGNGVCITLFNSSLQESEVQPSLLGEQVYRSDFDGNTLELIRSNIRIPGMGIRQVVVY